MNKNQFVFSNHYDMWYFFDYPSYDANFIKYVVMKIIKYYVIEQYDMVNQMFDFHTTELKPYKHHGSYEQILKAYVKEKNKEILKPPKIKK